MSQVKNDNIFVRAPKPIDGRTTLNSGSLYATVADFLADDAVTPYRYPSMTVPFVIDGNQVEYWFVDGIEDSDFQLKLSSVPSIPTLQQVTENLNSNSTTSAIQVIGNDNLDLEKSGVFLSYDLGTGMLRNIQEEDDVFFITGGVQFTTDETRLHNTAGTGIGINRTETSIVPLAVIDGRLRISDSINDDEAITRGEVEGLIPSLTNYALKDGTNATGTWPISVTGNSATTTAMTVFGASSTVLATNLGSSAVRLNATDSKVVDITGNAETVTNGVYTTGSYSNPSWINSLAYSKLTGVPNLSVFVPYTGATTDVNLGSHSLTVDGGISITGAAVSINETIGSDVYQTSLGSDYYTVQNTTTNKLVSILPDNGITLKTRTGTGSLGSQIKSDNVTATRVIQMPDASGTLALTSDIPSLSGYELLTNKQNSLAVDGTGEKYLTVDAANEGLVHKIGDEEINGIKTFIGNQLNIGVPNEFNLNNPIGVAVNKTLTILNNHAFEDNCFLNPESPTEILGYCSFDAKTILNNTNKIDHYSSFQSRPVLVGSGDIVNYVNGLRIFANHAGTSDLPTFSGIRIDDIDGTGPVISNFGIFINQMQRGSFENWNIFTTGGAQRFGGNTYIGDKLSVNTYDIDHDLNLTGSSYFSGTHQQNGNIQQLSGGSIKSALFLEPSISPTKYSIQTILDISISMQPGTVETLVLTPNKASVTGILSASSAPVAPTDVPRKQELDLKAPLASPTFTGNASNASAPTTGNHLTNKTYVDGLASNYVNTTANQTGLSGDKTWTGSHFWGDPSTNFTRATGTVLSAADASGNSITVRKTDILFNKAGSSTNQIYTPASSASSRTWTFPDASGTVALTSDFESGTYTPTFTNITNVTSITLSLCHYKRIGNEVTVFGSFTGLTTVSGGQQFTLSLPIASNFTNSENDLAGYGVAANNVGNINITLQASADTTTDTAHFSMESGAAASGSGRFSFTYTIK